MSGVGCSHFMGWRTVLKKLGLYHRPYGAALQAFVVVMVMGIYLTLSFYFTTKPVGVPPLHSLEKTASRGSGDEPPTAPIPLHRKGSTMLMAATVFVAGINVHVSHSAT